MTFSFNSLATLDVDRQISITAKVIYIWCVGKLVGTIPMTAKAEIKFRLFIQLKDENQQYVNFFKAQTLTSGKCKRDMSDSIILHCVVVEI
jgi:hypothetical protein